MNQYHVKFVRDLFANRAMLGDLKTGEHGGGMKSFGMLDQDFATEGEGLIQDDKTG